MRKTNGSDGWLMTAAETLELRIVPSANPPEKHIPITATGRFVAACSSSARARSHSTIAPVWPSANAPSSRATHSLVTFAMV